MELNEAERPLSNQARDNERDVVERETFLLTCVRYCAGLGNIWRFPYVAFNNGGGAFLIPYFIMFLICGMPLFLMELAMGQYFRLGPVSTWSATCPIAKGIGFAMITVAFLCTVYYNIVIAWVLYYMYASMGKEVPWKYCGNEWNTPNCLDDTTIKKFACFDVIKNKATNAVPDNMFSLTTNLTALLNTTECVKEMNYTFASQEYWERNVLQITKSLDDSGSMRYGLLICLIIAWAVVFRGLGKRIKFPRKVVYYMATFPYVAMFIFMIWGAQLEGAGSGVAYYLKPDFSKLGDVNVWVAATTQNFYSLGIGFGSLIVFGSYNKIYNNIVRDAVSLSLVNCFTSVFVGIVVFSVLGHMSHRSGVHISKVATAGPGLVFVVYPEGLSKMPISPLWAIPFFFMILMFGLDTQFAMLKAVVVGLMEEYRILKRKKPLIILFVCVMACFIGFSMVMQNGMYVFNIFNTQSGGMSLLFLVFWETIALAYGFGAERFEGNLEEIVDYKPYRWWKWCWKYFSPAVIFVIFITSLVQWKGLSYGTYHYPGYGEDIGWMLALASMVWIPLVALRKILKTPGTLRERFKQLSRPERVALERMRSAQAQELLSTFL